MSTLKQNKEDAKENVNAATVVDDLWHDIASNTNIDDCVMKYRKLSNQNILQIYVNGSNEIDISGSLDLGRLPKEYRPTNVEIIYGTIDLIINGEIVRSTQILNICDDGWVSITVGISSPYVIKNLVFYGMVNL